MAVASPRPKPAADPYRQAARFLGADPACCVAIEDSPVGVASAEAAGCVVLAVPSEVAIAAGSAARRTQICDRARRGRPGRVGVRLK